MHYVTRLPFQSLTCFTPAQEHAYITGLTIREVEHLGGQTESMRPKRRVPSLVDFRCFAAKRLRPRVIRRIIDRPGVICTRIAREAQQQELLFARLIPLTQVNTTYSM